MEYLLSQLIEDLCFGENYLEGLPKQVKIRMPEIPPEAASPAEHLFSQLENLAKKMKIGEGSTQHYRLMLDRESYRRLCSEKPEELKEEVWFRSLSSQLDRKIRPYSLSTLGIYTEEKSKAVCISIFRPMELSREH